MARPVVLVLIKGLGIGGAEKLVSEGARLWDRDRFDYRVAYILPWKDQLVGGLAALEVPVECIGSRRGLGPTAALRLRRLLTSWEVDLVHAHLPSAGILARLLSRIPVVYTEHNLAGSYRALTRAANRLTYRRNTAVTAVSQAVAASLAAHPGPQVQVVRNGVSVTVPTEQREAVRAELRLGPGERLVVHVGNIRPRKGHEMLVEAVRHLSDRHPEARVVSIGGEKHPGDLERVRGLARSAGVADSLAFLGRREDALAFIAAADVYVNPAEVEGLPVTVLEAMALERPVVATAVGGIPSLVEDRVTGLLVPPGDPHLLAEAIGELLERPDLAGSLGEKGRALVERDHGLEPMVNSFEQIYSDLLG